MKAILLSISLIMTLSTSILAQKFKIKDDIATMDGAPYLNWNKKMMGNEASVWSLNADGEQVFLSYQDFIDEKLISKSNPQGKVRYVEINFLELNLKCEITAMSHKRIAKMFYENGIFNDDGTLNEEKVNRFVNKYGTKFSEQRNQNNNVNIIINN